MKTYEDRGVSPHKPDVKKAVVGVSTNLYPGAFCWIIQDILSADPERVLVTHADGAGTKSSLAYIVYKETGDPRVFRGIAQDSLAMNVYDMIAVGAIGPYVLSNTIGRNAKLVPGEVIRAIIDGYVEQCDVLSKEGIDIMIGGGETADLGDLVRTLVVDTTLTASLRRSAVIDISKLKAGASIVGLASFGRARYETVDNSGIGTNGFSALRHELLSSKFLDTFPETYAPEIRAAAYQGRFALSDPFPNTDTPLYTYLLSPTRIYAPIVKRILEVVPNSIQGIINNSGGGQTKCMSFGSNVYYRKSAPIKPPPIFDFIQAESRAPLSELARTYNLGCLLEIYCDPTVVDQVIAIAASYGVHAQWIGEVADSAHHRELTIDLWGEVAHWTE